MKKFIGLIILSVLLFSQVVFADEDFSIWVSRNFLPANGVAFGDREIIGTSPEIMNPNGLKAFDLIIRYELLTPDSNPGPVSYNVHAVIEGAYLAGEWTPIHYQFEGINSISDFPLRMMTMVPYYNMPTPSGSSFEIKEGLTKKTRISLMSGQLLDVFRVRLVNSDPTGTSPLTSLRVSAFGRKFDEPLTFPASP